MINSPAVFLDMDGTVVRPKEGEFINDPENMVVMENVRSVLSTYDEKHLVLGVTNQGGVAHEHMGIQTYRKIKDGIMDLVPRIERIEFSPAMHTGGCPTFGKSTFLRKPQPGMLAAHESYWRRRGIQIDFAESVMVGDKPVDKKTVEDTPVDFIYADKFFLRDG